MATEAYVATLPKCDIHKYDMGDPNVDAAYDAPTKRGPWASMCEPCWIANRRSPELGTGKGQKYVLSVRGCSCGMADYGAPGHDGARPTHHEQMDRAKAALDAGDIDGALEAMGDGDPADFF